MPAFLFVLLALLPTAQPLAITGSVVDESGGAVAVAQVVLRSGDQIVSSTTSAEDGRFAFTDVRPGRYFIVVTAAGFAPITREVVVTSTSVDLTIRLGVAGIAESVAVTADAYRPVTSSTGTKLALSPLETAESVTTIPAALIQDRSLVRLSELANHVAGVRPLTGYTGTLSNAYTIRGFSPSLTNTTLRNGFAEYSFLSQRDVINIDRVEFLKGPASLLYGANEVGGVVNTITKQPLTVRRHEIGFTFGSHSSLRPTIDFTGPVDSRSRVLYRVNAAHDRGDSYRDFVNHENTFVAPALLWHATPRTSLSIELELGRFDNDFDRGFVIAPEFLDEDPEKNYAEPWTFARNRQSNTMVNFTHQLNANWRIRSGFNYIRHTTDTNAAGFAFVPLAPDRRTINRNNFYTHEVSRNHNSQNELYGTFRTGSIGHQLVAGGEATYYQFKYTFDFRSLASIDRINPVHGAQPGFYLFGFNDDSFSQSYAVFVQDQISLGPVRVLVGGRGSFLSSTSRDYATQVVKNEQDDNDFTPRAGIVYRVTPATSAYFSFTNSFQPNFASRSRTGEQFSPTRGRQYEVGVKQSLASERLLATFAYYELTKRDVLVPDPEDFTFSFSIQVGEQKSRGFETELIGAVTPAWKVIAAYSALDAFVSKDSRPTFIDQKLVAAPRHSGSLYSRYLFESGSLSGFSAGAGVFIVGERYASLPNPTWVIPGYTKVDADLGYQRDRWRVTVALKNLTNDRYFESGGFGAFMPQAPRHTLAALHVLF